MAMDRNSYEYKNNRVDTGKGQRWGDTKHLTEEYQEEYEEIFGKKKPWWERRDEKNGD